MCRNFFFRSRSWEPEPAAWPWAGQDWTGSTTLLPGLDYINLDSYCLAHGREYFYRFYGFRHFFLQFTIFQIVQYCVTGGILLVVATFRNNSNKSLYFLDNKIFIFVVSMTHCLWAYFLYVLEKVYFIFQHCGSDFLPESNFWLIDWKTVFDLKEKNVLTNILDNLLLNFCIIFFYDDIWGRQKRG